MDMFAHFFDDTSESFCRLATGNLKGLTIATQLPGGFADGSFTLPKQSFDPLIWRDSLLGRHLVITDAYGQRAYEGSVEDIEDGEDGLVVKGSGHYISTNHHTVYLSYPATPIDLKVVIEELVDLISEWRSTFVDTVPSLFEANTPLEFLYDTKVQEVLEKVLKENVTGLYQVQFAVYDQQRPLLFNVLRPWYRVSRSDLSVEYGSTITLGGMYNKIQVVYEVEGEKRFTSWFEDKASQGRYGIREGSITAGDIPVEVAQIAGELAIKKYAKPDENHTIAINGLVRDYTTGTPVFPYLVRAGHLLFVSDMPANPESRYAFEHDQYQAGYLLQRTSYSHDDGKLSVDIGDGMKSFEQYMADMGISGGSVK